jgi:hypothetical protein
VDTFDVQRAPFDGAVDDLAAGPFELGAGPERSVGPAAPTGFSSSLRPLGLHPQPVDRPTDQVSHLLHSRPAHSCVEQIDRKMCETFQVFQVFQARPDRGQRPSIELSIRMLVD